MATYDHLFEFHDNLGHEPIEFGPDGLTMEIDLANRKLIISKPGSPATEVDLTEAPDQRLRPAFWVPESDGKLHIGEVEYPGGVPTEFSIMLNNSVENVQFITHRTGGHIGILDIRDLSKAKSDRKITVYSFNWDRVPIVMWIIDNDLWFFTREDSRKSDQDSDSDSDSFWYEIKSISR